MGRRNRKGTSFTTIPEELLLDVKNISQRDGITIQQIFDDAIQALAAHIRSLSEEERPKGFSGWIPGRTSEPYSKPYNIRLGADAVVVLAEALGRTRVARDIFVVTALTRYVREHKSNGENRCES